MSADWIYPENFPITRGLLEKRGIRIDPVDGSEIIKAEGAVASCSVVFNSRKPTGMTAPIMPFDGPAGA